MDFDDDELLMCGDDDEEIKKIESPNKSKKSSGSKLDSKVPLYQ
jgi:hypothetical protein